MRCNGVGERLYTTGVPSEGGLWSGRHFRPVNVWCSGEIQAVEHDPVALPEGEHVFFLFSRNAEFVSIKQQR